MLSNDNRFYFILATCIKLFAEIKYFPSYLQEELYYETFSEMENWLQTPGGLLILIFNFKMFLII